MFHEKLLLFFFYWYIFIYNVTFCINYVHGLRRQFIFNKSKIWIFNFYIKWKLFYLWTFWYKIYAFLCFININQRINTIHINFVLIKLFWKFKSRNINHGTACKITSEYINESTWSFHNLFSIRKKEKKSNICENIILQIIV